MANLPKLISIGLGIGVSEPKFTSDPKVTSDDVRAAFRHEFPQAIGAWIFPLIKGCGTPKTFPLSSRSGGHKKP